MKVAQIPAANIRFSTSSDNATIEANVVQTGYAGNYVGALVAETYEEFSAIGTWYGGRRKILYRDGEYGADYGSTRQALPLLFSVPTYGRTFEPDADYLPGQTIIEAMFHMHKIASPQSPSIKSVAITNNGVIWHADLYGYPGGNYFSTDNGQNWTFFPPDGLGFINGGGGAFYVPIFDPNLTQVYMACVDQEWGTNTYSVFLFFLNAYAQSVPTAAQLALRSFYNVGDLSTDPYNPTGSTGAGGGQRPYNPFATDDIGFNLLPEVSAVGTGFLSLWCPTEQQMLDLSAYMWNANILTLDYWRKLIADPIQLVYGLNIIPLDLREAGIVGDSPEDVVVGMVSTGIKMDYLTSQWVELDCGSINIEEDLLGSYMDYEPYTRMDIYLPYIGYRALKVDDFMPGAMSIKYKIDLLTGACVAQILSTKSSQHDDTLDSIVYQFMGNCATQIPVTATQYADAVRSAITTAAAIGTVALLGGAGAALGAAGAGAEIMPVAPAAVAGALPTGPAMVSVDSSLYASMSQYNAMTMGSSVSSAASTLMNVGQVHAGASAASNVLNTKPTVQRSGAIGGAAGMLATQTPYIIFTRPRIAHPEDQNKYTGYPSFMTKKLSELSGFTQIQAIHLEGLACTSAELAEVDALLKSGVIF